LVIPLTGRPQEAVCKISLKEAIEQAVGYNKQLKASRKELDIYREKVKEAISGGLPQIATGVNYSTNFGYSMNLGGNSISMEDQADFTASVSQLIFDGQWIVGIKSSKLSEKLAGQQLEITELDIKKSVVDSYFVILVGNRNLEILGENLQNMEENLKHTRYMYEAGTVELTDVNQIRINVSTLKNSLLSTERSVEVNKKLLLLQLGLPAETRLELSDKLDSFLKLGDYMKLKANPFTLQINPEYRLQTIQTEVQEKMVSLQKWSFAPTISGTYSYPNKIMEPAFSMSPEHAGSITLSLPVFTGLQRRSALNQEKFLLEQAQLNKSYLEDELQLTDRQYRYELENALENYRLQKENIIVARQVLDNYKHKYEAGTISSLDLTTANNSYLQAESDFTAACLTLFQARTQMERLHNLLPY
ncbi:MAG: TolC family protein, partial [Mangrovibacterium sp.]